MKKKTALITGVNGQDGAYLSKFLLSKGYNVIGTVRSLNTNYYRLEHLNIKNKITVNFQNCGKKVINSEVIVLEKVKK